MSNEPNNIDPDNPQLGYTGPGKMNSDNSTSSSSNSGSNSSSNSTPEAPSGPQSLSDELKIQGLRTPITISRGRIFAAAGRSIPIAELYQQELILHSPDRPFDDSEEKLVDAVVHQFNEQGIVLDALGNPKKMSGARFKGNPIYCLNEKHPQSGKFLAAWFDENGAAHRLKLKEDLLAFDLAYKVRNKTIDGEISQFPAITSE